MLDFKTGKPSDEKSKMYTRQLQAYVMALENPVPNALGLSPVSKLALLYSTPDSCRQNAATRQVVEGEIECTEVERDDSAFLDFLGEVVSLLDGPLPVPQPDVCDWCKYRSRIGGHTGRGHNEAPMAADGSPIPLCPVCKGPMQLKKGRFGDFWSCMDYPACKGSRNA